MSNNDQEDKDSQRTNWYTDPRVMVICSIAGVGTSLAALLLATGLWVLSSLQTGSEEVPPAADRVEVGSDRRELGTEGESGDRVETVTSGDLPNIARDDEAAGTGSRSTAANRDVSLSSDTDFSQIIHGRTVSLVEPIDARRPVFIVAESVEFSSGALLRGPQIWIFADSIRGGLLDVSGVDRTTDTPNGADAGSIYVLANEVHDVEIVAVGGNGHPGVHGAAGPNGRDGSCAGFGSWRAAQRGGNGAPGAAGGTGGAAGDVRVVFAVSYGPQNVNISPGTGGAGGHGGVGGAGGDGCVGLGGAQASAASGSPGPPGAPGQKGGNGSLEVERKPALVAKNLDWVRKRSPSVEVLQYVRRAEYENMYP